MGNISTFSGAPDLQGWPRNRLQGSTTARYRFDVGAGRLLKQAENRPDLSNRIDLLSLLFIDSRTCSSIPGVARALHFGVGFLVVLGLLHERRPLSILNLQF